MGLALVLVWLAVLVVTIVLRRRVDYETHKPLLCAPAPAAATTVRRRLQPETLMLVFNSRVS